MTTSKSPVRFVDGAHILMSDGWVVRAAARPELVPLMPPLPHAVCDTTALTPRARSCCKMRPRARASSCSSKLAARRAKQRWSALVSASTSGLARPMRSRLRDVHWAAFMRHANRQYKAAFVKYLILPKSESKSKLEILSIAAWPWDWTRYRYPGPGAMCPVGAGTSYHLKTVLRT